MATLTAQTVSVAGTAPTYTAASDGGDETPVGSGLVLYVRNGSTADITVTVTTPGTIQGLAIADATLSVPAAKSGFVPLDGVYRSPSTGRASVTYSASASVDVAVLQIPR